MYKNRFFILIFLVLSFLTIFLMFSFFSKYKIETYEDNLKQYKKLSNCVVPTKVMEKALKVELDEKNKGYEIKFTTIISFLAAKYYGNWNKYKEKDIDELVKKFYDGENEEDLKYVYNNFSYFKEFYDALFCQFIGQYYISSVKDSKKQDDLVFEEKYGLKAFSPIAYGYISNFCDDFDNEINFAKQKGHFGNDIAVKKGTPFVAVESGKVENIFKEGDVYTLELKSIDGRRTYIYSNCNTKNPFAKEVKKGAVVRGGQFLGVVGSGACCEKGCAQILNCPYLHFAIKLNLKNKNEVSKEIYVDSYNILKFLEHNKEEFDVDSGKFSPKRIFIDETLKENFEIA